MLGLKIILLFFISAQIRTQCCLKFQGNRCVSCPSGTHLYRGSCLNDLDNCASYRDGFDCEKCVNGYQFNQNGQCILKALPQSSSNQFTDTVVDFQQLKGPVPPILSKSLDYLLSTKPVLRNLKAISGSVRSYKNGNNQVTLQFKDNSNYFKSVLTTNQQGTFFSQSAFNQVISPTIPTTSTIPAVSAISATPSIPSIDINNQLTGSDNVINSGIKQINDFISAAITGQLNYVPIDNPQADQNYPIISDFIGFVQPEFAKFQPIKITRAFDNQVTYYYKLTYVIADGSSWQLSTKLDTNTFVATFQAKTQLAGPSKSSNPSLVTIELSKIYEDMYFIMVYDSINKQFNNKYSESAIRSVDKSDDTSTARYVINFQQSGFVWEVVCQINKATFATNGIQQTRKQSISSTSGTGSIIVSPNPINPIPVNPIVNPTPPPVIPPVIPIVNPTPPVNPTQPTIPNPPINPNPPVNPPTVNPPTVNPPGNPNISNPANPPPFNPPPPTPNPQSASKPPSLPDRILAGVGKMTQVPASDYSSTEFKEIDLLIRQINSKELTNGQLVGIFYTSTSFSRNYLVYYQKGPQIYEARVSRDMIRKRNYVIGFNKV